MKKISYLFLFLFSFLSCAEAPTQFSEAALNDTFTTLEGNTMSLKSILEKHEGKTIVIDIWASWCGDCIQGMPKVKALQEAYPEAAYLFFSLDRGEAPWKRGIKKYDVVGEHYFLPKGKKSSFGDFVSIGWIPRYMVINKAGEIVVFDVIEADDEKLIAALKN
ncbi:TlpA family protein disulfide reductase [Hyunsoonleella flava]|uniref:TlpA family protein disulfide reductase n=1 Tax=Hyunsoonleella flava TaxID=2527939 RepID=A0A4Q9FBY0_9FLAO|nr:TlpA disulfide reductase family protein [Hyunsoonleella flava]TBN00428.1 TlpA family protein disulfide reductase [Hyunsoonleella flava]